jgi:hypothetical protein
MVIYEGGAYLLHSDAPSTGKSSKLVVADAAVSDGPDESGSYNPHKRTRGNETRGGGRDEEYDEDENARYH